MLTARDDSQADLGDDLAEHHDPERGPDHGQGAAPASQPAIQHFEKLIQDDELNINVVLHIERDGEGVVDQDVAQQDGAEEEVAHPPHRHDGLQ